MYTVTLATPSSQPAVYRRVREKDEEDGERERDRRRLDRRRERQKEIRQKEREKRVILYID